MVDWLPGTSTEGLAPPSASRSAAAWRGVGGEHSLHGRQTLARETIESISSSGSLQRQSLGSVTRSALRDPSF